jgi:acyl dehydratase
VSLAENTIEEVKRRVGEELGCSEWQAIEQQRIDDHARNTGDADWLHNDVERAAKESPFDGKTIAQGSLLVSMLVGFVDEVAPVGDDVAFALNYGFDRLRFIRPVPVGSRVRARMALAGVEPRGEGRHLLRIDASLEQEGEEKPCVAAQWLGMLFAARE